MDRFWRLIIRYKDSDAEFVVGSEEVIRAAYNEIREDLLRPDDGTIKSVTVIGISDTADRSQLEYTFIIEHIKSVGLIEL